MLSVLDRQESIFLVAAKRLATLENVRICSLTDVDGESELKVTIYSIKLCLNSEMNISSL